MINMTTHSPKRNKIPLGKASGSRRDTPVPIVPLEEKHPSTFQLKRASSGRMIIKGPFELNVNSEMGEFLHTHAKWSKPDKHWYFPASDHINAKQVVKVLNTHLTEIRSAYDGDPRDSKDLGLFGWPAESKSKLNSTSLCDGVDTISMESFKDLKSQGKLIRLRIAPRKAEKTFIICYDALSLLAYIEEQYAKYKIIQEPVTKTTLTESQIWRVYCFCANIDRAKLNEDDLRLVKRAALWGGKTGVRNCSRPKRMHNSIFQKRDLEKKRKSDLIKHRAWEAGMRSLQRS